MSERPDLDDDDALLAALSSTLAAAEPLRPELDDEIRRAAWTSRAIDAELLALLADSVVDAGAVRAGGEDRHLTFGAGSVAVDLTLGRRGEVVGSVAPGDQVALEVEEETGTTTVEVDEHGRFRSSIASRRFRLVLRTDATSFRSAWVFR